MSLKFYIGGTILGTARLPEFVDPKVKTIAVDNLNRLGIDTLLVEMVLYHGIKAS